MALSRLWLNILTSKRRIAFTATAFVRVVGGLRKKKPGFGYRAERGEPFAQLTHDFIAAREANNARARNFNNFCHIPDGGQERIQLIARSGKLHSIYRRRDVNDLPTENIRVTLDL